MQSLWTGVVKPITDSILLGTIPFPEINKVAQENQASIANLYSTSLTVRIWINLFGHLHDDGNKTTLFACGLVNNNPQVAVFLSILDRAFFHIIKYKHGNTQLGAEIFQNTVLVGVMHEIDHIALGLIGKKEDPIQTLIDIECAVWAKTCKDTLSPLIEQYGKEFPYYKSIYDEWVLCGRSAESQRWKDSIAKTYGG